jgi:hypothetical protein
MSELSKEEKDGYQIEAAELAKKHGVSKVHVYVGINPETDERIVGFLKEPNYIQKIFTLDRISSVGIFTAGDELRNILTLKEESDPKTYGDTPDCDSYKLGMTGTCVPIVDVIKNSFKKK